MGDDINPHLAQNPCRAEKPYQILDKLVERLHYIGIMLKLHYSRKHAKTNDETKEVSIL